MNVSEYDHSGKAGFRLTTALVDRLCSAKSKYIRFTLNATGNIDFNAISAESISSDDYVIRLESSSNLVIAGQVYSKIYGKDIGVTEGLKGTELYFK